MSDNATTIRPWYKDGLRFQVHRLRRLLHRRAGLRVGQQGRHRRARRRSRNSTSTKFEARYVREIGVRKSLIEYDNGDCVFFDGKTRKCRVYAARPRQCRTWPFWDSNIRTPEAWAETCEVCPAAAPAGSISSKRSKQQAAVIRI